MIVLYFIFFLFLYLGYKKSILLKPLLGLYVLGSLFAIYVYFLMEQKVVEFTSVVFQILIIILFFYPVFSYCKHERKLFISPPNLFLFNCISWFFIILGLISIIFFIPVIIKVFTGDIAAIRIALTQGEVLVKVGLLNTISGTIATFYSIMLLFYFYSICFLKKSKYFNTLLLLASLSYVFYVFAYAGRDGILFWMFSFIYSFCLFKPYMNRDTLRKCKKKLFLIGGIGGIGFIAITIARFSLGGNLEITPILESIISYQGQIFCNFSEYYANVPPVYSLTPIFGLLDSEKEVLLKAREDFMLQYGIDPNIFKGFVVSIYSSFGTFFSILVASVYALTLSRYFKGKTTSFSKLIILTLVYQIPFHNYYYFKLSNNVGTLYIISVILLSIVFSKCWVIKRGISTKH